MIENIILQVPQQTFSDVVYGYIWYILVGIAVLVVGFLGYIAMRIKKAKFDYDNPDGSPTHGFWQVWVKGDVVMEGWLSTNEVLNHFDELDLVEKYAKENGVEMNVSEIKKGVRNEEIFVFNLRRTDDFDLLEKHGKRTRLLLSNNPLDQKNHWYLPVKGKHGLSNIVMTERPKVICLEFETKKIEVPVEGKEIEDWYIGAVDPHPKAGYYEYGFEKETVKNMRYVRNLTFNSGFEKLARSASLFAQMFKAIVEREDLAERNKAQAKIIEDKEKELKKVNQKFQLANYALDQKKYVDKGKTVLMGDSAIGAIVVIFAMLFGVIIYEMFPDIFPTLTHANWVGFGIACVLVYLGIRSIIKSKQKEQMKIQTEDTEVK